MHRERKSPRLKNWDYTNNGLYFVTICTKDRKHYFGEIKNGKMLLSPVGAIANVLWAELGHRNKTATLGEFIVMPNHIHGIIELDNLNSNTDIAQEIPNLNSSTDIARKNPDINSSTDVARNVPGINSDNHFSKISPKPNSLSAIIRSYKSAVTKHCNRLNLDFGWQSRYHDHIIRNEKSFQNISNYIIYNPQNWKEDQFN